MVSSCLKVRVDLVKGLIFELRLSTVRLIGQQIHRQLLEEIPQLVLLLLLAQCGVIVIHSR